MKTMITPMVTRQRSKVWWVCVVLLCLAAGFIGGVAGTCLTVPMIANQWLQRMEGAIPAKVEPQTTGELPEPFDPIGPIPKDLLNSTPSSKESADVMTTEVIDPDPGELPDLPDDEYLCESVELVILPIGGNVWQLAQEVDKDQKTRVDWDALLRVYPDEVARTLQAGAIIAIPIKGKLGPLATKIAYGD